MTKTVYAYDGSGKYVGERTLDDTDRSPISGVWQIPGNMTEEIPPAAKEGHDRYYVGGKWEYREVPKPETPPEPKEEEPQEDREPYVDETAAALAEAVASQEAEIAALKAEVEALKGGDKK